MSRARAGLEVAEVLMELTRAAWLMRVRGRRAVAQATQRAMSTPGATRTELNASGTSPIRVMRAVRRAKRVWPIEARCLQTAFAIRAVLARRGVPSTLRLGVRDDGDDYLFHAWIETGGLVFDDQHFDIPFVPLTEAPDDPAASARRGSPASAAMERGA